MSAVTTMSDEYGFEDINVLKIMISILEWTDSRILRQFQASKDSSHFNLCLRGLELCKEESVDNRKILLQLFYRMNLNGLDNQHLEILKKATKDVVLLEKTSDLVNFRLAQKFYEHLETICGPENVAQNFSELKL